MAPGGLIITITFLNVSKYDIMTEFENTETGNYRCDNEMFLQIKH